MNAHVNPNRLRLSACTITKNEAENIARSIESYKDVVDEIIIVDTGSADETVQIAEGFGARILHFEWCNDFAKAKNAALDIAAGDWIIFLDADEYFAEGYAEKIRGIIQKAERAGYNVIACRMVNYDLKAQKAMSEFSQTRIFKAGIRYQYPIHEMLVSQGGLRIKNVGRSLLIYHTGYASSAVSQKTQRNLPLLIREMNKEKDPYRICAYNAYLANTYFLMKAYQKSREYGIKYIDFCEKNGFSLVGHHSLVYVLLVNTYELENAEPEMMLRWVERAEAHFPNHPDVVDARARAMLRKRLYSKAAALFTRAQELAQGYNGLEICSVKGRTDHYYYSMGLASEGMLNIPDAIEYYVRAVDANEGFAEPMVRLFALVKAMPEKELDAFVDSLFRQASVTKKASILIGLMRNYMYSQVARCYSQYKVDEKLDSYDLGVLAFNTAAKGNYDGAAGLFQKKFEAEKDDGDAMRALLCAVLAGDEEAVGRAKAMGAKPAVAAALGREDGYCFTKGDLLSIAAMVFEAGRMRGSDYAASLALEIAARLPEDFLRDFARALEYCFEFAGALAVAQRLRLTPESVFLEAFYTARLGRYAQAYDLLLAAKQLGFREEEADELSRNLIDKLAGRSKAACPARVKGQIAALIQSGGCEQALAQLRQLKEGCLPDWEIYSLTAVALYQIGEYKYSLLAALAGLALGDDKADLYINAGEAYLMLGRKDEAARMLQKGLPTCTDPGARAYAESLIAQTL